MSIRRRVEAAERKSGGTKATVAFFRNLLLDKTGDVADEIWSATIMGGPNNGKYLKRGREDSYEEFRDRALRVANGGPEERPDGAALLNELSPTIVMRTPHQGGNPDETDGEAE